MLESNRNYINTSLIFRLFFWIVFWINFGWFFFYLLGFVNPLTYYLGYLLSGYFLQFLEIGILFLLSLGVFGLMGVLIPNKLSIVFWVIIGAIYWAIIGLIYNTMAQESRFFLFYPLSSYLEDFIWAKGLNSTLMEVVIWGAIIGGIGGFVGSKLLVILNKAYMRNERGVWRGFVIGSVIIWVSILLVILALEFISSVAYGISSVFTGIVTLSVRAMIVSVGTGGLLGFLIGGRRKPQTVKH